MKWGKDLVFTLGALIVLGGCEWPFSTKLNDSENLLNLQVEYDGRRISDTLQISLTWSEATVEYFKYYEIERRNVSIGEVNYVHVQLVTNAFALSFTDTINDDATYDYRLSLVDQEDRKLISNASITIRPTTHLNYPGEIDSLHNGPPNPLLDDGDSIFVLSGQHKIRPIDTGAKALHIISEAGAAQTLLLPLDTLSIPDLAASLITLRSGSLVGFTITRSSAHNGGAVSLSGSAMM